MVTSSGGSRLPTCRQSVELERDGTVVRALHVGQDPGGLDAAAQLFRDEEVVDAPADVPRPRPALHVPPRVVARLAHEEPEGVVVAVTEILRHPRPLLGQEPRGLLVLLVPREITLGV